MRTTVMLAAILALSSLATAGSGSPASVALEISTRGRASVPGEPIRVVARSPVALESLGARFLDEPVFMAPVESGPGEIWAGWTLIALDQEPALAAIEVSGRTTDGRPALGTMAMQIQAKSFPEERLSVSSNYVEPPRETRERLARERERLAEIYLLRSPQMVATTFVRPVPGKPTSVFGTRRFFNDQPRSPHPGLDLRAATGTPVVASGAGEVVMATDLFYSGNTVIVDHGGGLFTLYAHLDEIAVVEGAEVQSGSHLGSSGATGRVTGPHLHWGAKIGNRPFDPRALLDPALFSVTRTPPAPTAVPSAASPGH
jgi:murein DD-endopeptidase MepM/ murein hydrolase activator NlpD